jgi:hypothetical protein
MAAWGSSSWDWFIMELRLLPTGVLALEFHTPSTSIPL